MNEINHYDMIEIQISKKLSSVIYYLKLKQYDTRAFIFVET